RLRSEAAIADRRTRLRRSIRGQASHHLRCHWALRKIEKGAKSLAHLARLAILETQNEDEQRTAGDLIAVTELEGGRFGPAGDVAVDQTEPALALRHLGKRELHDIVVGIGNQQKSRVIATPLDAGRLRTAIQEHAETPCFGIFPLPLIHFLPGG